MRQSLCKTGSRTRLAALATGASARRAAPGLLPLPGLSAIVRGMQYRPADAIDVSGLRRALVIQLRHHGDVLLASPVFTVLKRHAPR